MGVKLRIRYCDHQVTVEVEPSATFREIAQDFSLLRKKANSYSQPLEIEDCVPRMLSGEIFFRWDQPVSEMLRLSWVFREKEPNQESLEDLIEHIIIVAKKDIGDAARRLSLRADPDEQALYTGYLWKKGSGAMAGFKRRWFILQGCTLYYQEDPSSSIALGYIPMGGCEVKLRSDLTHKTFGKTMFELTAESLGKRDFVLCAESVDDMDRFIAAVEALNLRRVKSVAVNVFEELTRRGYMRMQGIFRVSGDKNTVDAIKRAYDMSAYPNLTEYKDEHAIGSVLKLALRQMSKPLMPYDLYNSFVQMGRSAGSRRAILARDLVYQIPAASRHFLQYLCKSLNEVASHHDSNMMTAKNLAIVFAPNILRPKVETVQTSMSDNAAILACVNTLIEEQTLIFGPSPIRSNSIVPIFPPHLEGANSFSIGSKKKQKGTDTANTADSENASLRLNNSQVLAVNTVHPNSDEGKEVISKIQALTVEAKQNLEMINTLRQQQEAIIEQFKKLDRTLQLAPFQADGLVEFISDKTTVDFSSQATLIEQIKNVARNLHAINEQLEANVAISSPNSSSSTKWASPKPSAQRRSKALLSSRVSRSGPRRLNALSRVDDEMYSVSEEGTIAEEESVPPPPLPLDIPETLDSNTQPLAHPSESPRVIPPPLPVLNPSSSNQYQQ